MRHTRKSDDTSVLLAWLLWEMFLGEDDRGREVPAGDGGGPEKRPPPPPPPHGPSGRA